MKINDFFKRIAKFGQDVEIYFKQGERDGLFGFKINKIDGSDIYNLSSEDIIFKILDEINTAFVCNSDLIENGEGETSYFLKPDYTCTKKAEYFDSITETSEFWIEKNETNFDFGKVKFPFYSILITKELDIIKIDDNNKLKKLISKETYNSFINFYENLLNQFQEMEIELQFDVDDENNTITYINSMYGVYTENVNFTLLDKSSEEYSELILENLLIKYFKIEQLLSKKICSYELTL